MRYSFHGKVRATGQQVDGFVEADNSTQAIDRLADKGIIGVYSVHPEQPSPRHPVTLAGQAQPPDPRIPRDRRLAGKPDSRLNTAPAPEKKKPEAPAPPPTSAPVPATAAAPATPPVEAVADTLKQLVEKIAALSGKIDSLMSRPAAPYSPIPREPARNFRKTNKPAGGEVQNSTLRDIFQNNLDLRQSLEKLAKTVGPTPVRAKAVAVDGHDGASPDDSQVPASKPMPRTQAQPAA